MTSATLVGGIVMIGLVILIALCVAMGKIADADDRSGLLWGATTFVVYFGVASLVRYPLVDFIVTGVLIFAALIAANVMDARRHSG